MHQVLIHLQQEKVMEVMLVVMMFYQEGQNYYGNQMKNYLQF
jgi:hypothetical protein